MVFLPVACSTKLYPELCRETVIKPAAFALSAKHTQKTTNFIFRCWHVSACCGDLSFC